MKKKLFYVVIVLVIIGLIVLNIKTYTEKENLRKTTEDYEEKISKQTSLQTSYSLTAGTYTVGDKIPAGTATIVAIDGSGSYYLSEGKDLKTSNLIGDYEAFKINKTFKCIYKFTLKKGETLKITGSNLKVNLIYNMLG